MKLEQRQKMQAAKLRNWYKETETNSKISNNQEVQPKLAYL